MTLYLSKGGACVMTETVPWQGQGLCNERLYPSKGGACVMSETVP